ncbi:MAG: cohesin domain-containing protein [Chloroflexota bacterium]
MRPSTRIHLAILLAAFALGLAFPAAAQTPQALISAGSGSGLPGATGIPITVSLTSQGGAQVSGVSFYLEFDNTRLSVAGVAIGSAASAAGKVLSWSQPISSQIRVIVFDIEPNPEAIADGPVAVVTFDVLASAAAGVSDLTLSNAAASDPNGVGIPTSLSPGTFTVLAPTATPTRTATSTQVLTATPTHTATRTSSPTSGGPTATSGPTSTPAPTRTRTATPTRTATGGPTATSGPTRTNTLVATITRTLAPGTTPSSTASATLLSGGSPAATPSPFSTTIPAGQFLPELETAAAATGTALALFEQAVIATTTALAGSAPEPSATSRPPLLPNLSTLPFGGMLLLLGLVALGFVGLAGLAGVWLWRRRAARRRAEEKTLPPG